jgi:hypothetical protein
MAFIFSSPLESTGMAPTSLAFGIRTRCLLELHLPEVHVQIALPRMPLVVTRTRASVAAEVSALGEC